MTYKKFIEKYRDEIDLLDIYDQYGYDVTEDFVIQDNTEVTEINRRGGYFDITVELHSWQLAFKHN